MSARRGEGEAGGESRPLVAGSRDAPKTLLLDQDRYGSPDFLRGEYSAQAGPHRFYTTEGREENQQGKGNFRTPSCLPSTAAPSLLSGSLNDGPQVCGTDHWVPRRLYGTGSEKMRRRREILSSPYPLAKEVPGGPVCLVTRFPGEIFVAGDDADRPIIDSPVQHFIENFHRDDILLAELEGA